MLKREKWYPRNRHEVMLLISALSFTFLVPAVTIFLLIIDLPKWIAGFFFGGAVFGIILMMAYMKRREIPIFGPRRFANEGRAKPGEGVLRTRAA